MADEKMTPPPDDIDAIRQQVSERVAEEKAEAPKDAPKKQPELTTHTFVVECARALDKGAGILFATMMRDKFINVPEKKEQWFAWKDNYWEEVFSPVVRAAAERVAECFDKARILEQGKLKDMDEEDKEGRQWTKFNLKILRSRINTLHEPKGVTSCLRFALDNDDPLLVKAEKLDQTPMRLACENGVVDMRTGDLFPGRPQDYITRHCPASWAGLDAPAPKWEAMLLEIFGENKEVLHYFQKLIGYAMGGKVTEKLFVILLGEEGDSGKTTIFETLYEIVQGYAAPMPVELLLEQSGATQNPHSPTPAIMAMKALRITWASEPGESRRFSVDRIKLMSGLDSLTGRNPWDVGMTTFPPTHTLFLLTNHKMRASAHDTAFWGRVRLIECPYSFVSNPSRPNQRKRKDGLKDDIVATEAAGVLAWIVRGYQLFLREGLSPPNAVLEASAKYQREEDVIAEWLESCVQLDADAAFYETQADLYEVFHGWHLLNYGKRDLPTQIKFGKLLGKKIKKEKIGGQIRYYGVKIHAEVSRRFLDKIA
jgi:putative DNA primase/helicase